jgi:tryptophanase
MDIKSIYHLLADHFDIIYFSARKLGFAKGGIITSKDAKYTKMMMEYIPLYEGFLTYGGMDVRSMEAMAQGLYESLDMEYINQGPEFINYLAKELHDYGVPVVLPAGGLGCHLNAGAFVPEIPHNEYPAAAVAAALYIAGGIRGMERGTLSEERNPDGTEHFASVEMVRLAFPRRVFTLSQTEYVIDRVKWLYDHRHMVGGLRFVHEPKTLRFFTGRLEPVGDWPEKLLEAYIADFGQDQ